MTWFTFLPGAITLTLSICLGRIALPLHPEWSGRLLCTVAMTTALATVGTFVFIAANYWASLQPQAADRLPEWALIGDDDPVPASLGVPAVVLTLASTVVIVGLATRWISEVRSAQEASQHLLETDVPLAFAVPGKNGGVL